MKNGILSVPNLSIIRKVSLPVFFRNIVDIPVHIFPGNRQIFEVGQNMTADFGQHFRLVGADIKHLLIFPLRRYLDVPQKTAQLPGATRRFK